MREITNYIRRRASRKIIFEEPSEATAPMFVWINPPLFNWVIENLMRNALDAMEEGTGKIMWEVHDHPHDVEIDVIDTGKGIPPSKIKTVFDLFTTKQEAGDWASLANVLLKTTTKAGSTSSILNGRRHDCDSSSEKA
jgi:signal transduction histidine kinase